MQFLAKSSLILLSFLSIGCNSQVKKQNNNAIANNSTELKVIAFYSGKVEDADKYDVSKLTHLIFCFTRLQGNQIAFEKTDGDKILTALVALKKKQPKLKVLISFGGWGGCETCSDVFSTPEDRKAFAKSVKDMLVKFNADGLDLDWESPVMGGYKNHKAKPEDKDNFTALVKELRTTMPKGSELCFDANTFREFLQRSINWKAVMPLVDYVNLMSYGLPYNLNRHTGHHTALYSTPGQTESADSGVRYLDSIGVPMNKMIIGAGFYGFSYQNVDSINNGLHRPCKWKGDNYYKTIEENYLSNADYVYHWDSIAQAPYLYNDKENVFITYDDYKSVRLKTKYAIDKKLGGIMFWRINGDKYKDGLLDAIYNEKMK